MPGIHGRRNDGSLRFLGEQKLIAICGGYVGIISRNDLLRLPYTLCYLSCPFIINRKRILCIDTTPLLRKVI